MIRGLYTSATGMVTQKKRLDVVTNNLANSMTTGFKEDEMISSTFENELLIRTDDPSIISRSGKVGTINGGIHIDEVITNFGEGVYKSTDIATDLALTGDGFFTISTTNGERYTRAGDFEVSQDGFLVTKNGERVQGQKGSIYVGGTDFNVSTDGTVSSKYGMDRLKIVTFEDKNVLRKQGNNLYEAYGGTAVVADDYSVKQGTLEGSNVDMVKQMVDMMEISRSFEINQRMLRMQDERLGKSVNEVGKL